jgi:hypothetical protein
MDLCSAYACLVFKSDALSAAGFGCGTSLCKFAQRSPLRPRLMVVAQQVLGPARFLKSGLPSTTAVAPGCERGWRQCWVNTTCSTCHMNRPSKIKKLGTSCEQGCCVEHCRWGAWGILFTMLCMSHDFGTVSCSRRLLPGDSGIVGRMLLPDVSHECAFCDVLARWCNFAALSSFGTGFPSSVPSRPTPFTPLCPPKSGC